MKRRITLSVVCALCIVLVSMMSSTVKAQNQIKVVADTGMISLGENQVLRISASPAGGNYTFAFRRMEYTQPSCIGSVCKQSVSSQTTSPQIMVTSGEAVSFDIPASFMGGVFVGVRGMVFSNSRNVRVTCQIIDAITGKIVSILDSAQDVGNGDPITQA
jgi:hypothetical protein